MASSQALVVYDSKAASRWPFSTAKTLVGLALATFLALWGSLFTFAFSTDYLLFCLSIVAVLFTGCFTAWRIRKDKKTPFGYFLTGFFGLSLSACLFTVWVGLLIFWGSLLPQDIIDTYRVNSPIIMMFGALVGIAILVATAKSKK